MSVKAVNTPTTNPGRRNARYERKEGKCYLKIEKDNPAYEFLSPVDDYLEKESLTKPGEDMYHQVYEDKRFVTLEYDEADQKAIMKSDVDRAEAIDPLAKGGADYTKFEDQNGTVFTSE